MRDIFKKENKPETRTDCQLCNGEGSIGIYAYEYFKNNPAGRNLTNNYNSIYPAVWIKCPLCSKHPNHLQDYLERSKKYGIDAYKIVCEKLWMQMYYRLGEEQADKLAKDLGISDAITEEFKQGFIQYKNNVMKKIKQRQTS